MTCTHQQPENGSIRSKSEREGKRKPEKAKAKERAIARATETERCGRAAAPLQRHKAARALPAVPEDVYFKGYEVWQGISCMRRDRLLLLLGGTFGIPCALPFVFFSRFSLSSVFALPGTFNGRRFVEGHFYVSFIGGRWGVTSTGGEGMSE